MTTQCYTVTPHSIEALLSWVKSGMIAIPEIQRPFVWDSTDVRNMLDSLYRGFPVGYLITWSNPGVKLKDGTHSRGKKILIDGQQRVTALMAALLGTEVVTKDYRTVRIRIAFHPQNDRFEVANPAIDKDNSWIPDISKLFSPEANLLEVTNKYAQVNPGVDLNNIFNKLNNLTKIISHHIGVIDLAEELDIETVTEIFIRVNSSGDPLSQADFAMSKIAVNETYGGNTLRKAIDYFCHMAVTPEFFDVIKKNEPIFTQTEYFSKMAWLRKETDAIYDPSYKDMLRVAFTSEFRRGKLQDLVALLSGRNFETKEYEETILEDTFIRLRTSVMRFMNEDDFKEFVLIIRSAGFIDPTMISSQNALNMAYILYLSMRKLGFHKSEIQRYVRRWFVLSVITGRYSGSSDSTIDYDIRQIDELGIEDYSKNVEQSELSNIFWEVSLPQSMDTSSISSPYFRVFQAAQVVMNEKGFLSKDYFVRDLIEVKADVHHIYPVDFLKQRGLTRSHYNQIANYVVTQSEINIAIGNKEPKVYFRELLDQCNGGVKRYGNITNMVDLLENYSINCIPEDMENATFDNYQDFLSKRRKLMANKMRKYFEGL